MRKKKSSTIVEFLHGGDFPKDGLQVGGTFVLPRNELLRAAAEACVDEQLPAATTLHFDGRRLVVKVAAQLWCVAGQSFDLTPQVGFAEKPDLTLAVFLGLGVFFVIGCKVVFVLIVVGREVRRDVGVPGPVFVEGDEVGFRFSGVRLGDDQRRDFRDEVVLQRDGDSLASSGEKINRL